MRGKVRLPEGGKLKLILEERLAEMGPMTVSEKRLLTSSPSSASSALWSSRGPA